MLCLFPTTGVKPYLTTCLTTTVLFPILLYSNTTHHTHHHNPLQNPPFNSTSVFHLQISVVMKIATGIRTCTKPSMPRDSTKKRWLSSQPLNSQHPLGELLQPTPPKKNTFLGRCGILSESILVRSRPTNNWNSVSYKFWGGIWRWTKTPSYQWPLPQHSCLIEIHCKHRITFNMYDIALRYGDACTHARRGARGTNPKLPNEPGKKNPALLTDKNWLFNTDPHNGYQKNIPAPSFRGAN